MIDRSKNKVVLNPWAHAKPLHFCCVFNISNSIGNSRATGLSVEDCCVSPSFIYLFHLFIYLFILSTPSNQLDQVIDSERCEMQTDFIVLTSSTWDHGLEGDRILLINSACNLCRRYKTWFTTCSGKTLSKIRIDKRPGILFYVKKEIILSVE